MDDPGRKLLREATRFPSATRGVIAVAASLGMHVLFLAVLDTAGTLSPARPPALPVVFVPVTPDQWAVNRLASGASSAERDRTYRIVELPPDVERDPLRAEVPPPSDARHLAARPQSVVEERVSRDAGATEGDLLRVAQRAFEGVEGSGEHGKEPFSARGRKGPRGAGGLLSERPPRANSSLPEAPDERLAQAPPVDPEEPPSAPPFEAILPLPGGEDGQRIAGERIAGLPTRELPRPEGGPNMDGAGEVPEGDETRLDAHVVESASFWVSVRNRIEGEWQKRAVETFKRVDPREDVYFWKQRTAVLKVALDAAGELRKVEVLESSTLEFFDDVAVEAIRASRYPPPPPEALADNGEASIQVRITWLPSLQPNRLR